MTGNQEASPPQKSACGKGWRWLRVNWEEICLRPAMMAQSRPGASPENLPVSYTATMIQFKNLQDHILPRPRDCSRLCRWSCTLR